MRNFCGILFASLFVISGCQSTQSGGLNIGSGYGSWYGNSGRHRPSVHRGVDLLANVGIPIIASADGVVIFSGESAAGRKGIRIDLEHEVDGVIEAFTIHGHLDKSILAVGDKVKRGQVIGHIGLTGATTDAHPHVHYEVLTYDYIHVDPEILVSGCYDPQANYPTDKLVLTWPLKC